MRIPSILVALSGSIALTLFGIVLTVQPGNGQTGFAVQGGQGSIPMEGERQKAQFQGAISIAISGEAELLLTDPSGRQTGFDPVSNKSFAQIPAAGYGDDSIDDPNDNSDDPVGIQEKKLELSPVVPGLYIATITAVAKGTYDLEFTSFGSNFEQSQFSLKDIPIAPGMRHVYAFKAPIKSGRYFPVFGACSSHSATERLLSYASMCTDKITLPSRTRVFPFIVFYGTHVNPSTFAATLDGQSATQTFQPTPGGHDIVRLPLHQGQNILVLSVAAEAQSGLGNSDRFEFTVP